MNIKIIIAAVWLRTKAALLVSGLLLGLTMLTACAASSETTPVRLPTDAEVDQYNATVPPEERIVCRMERGVESNIPRRVCRMVQDVADTSAFHREQLRRVLQ